MNHFIVCFFKVYIELIVKNIPNFTPVLIWYYLKMTMKSDFFLISIM